MNTWTERAVQQVLKTSAKSFNRPVVRVLLVCGHYYDEPGPGPSVGTLVPCLKCAKPK